MNSIRAIQEKEGNRSIPLGMHTMIISILCGAMCLDDDRYHKVQRGIPSSLVIQPMVNQRPIVVKKSA